jgi:hypothetical protein
VKGNRSAFNLSPEQLGISSLLFWPHFTLAGNKKLVSFKGKTQLLHEKELIRLAFFFNCKHGIITVCPMLPFHSSPKVMTLCFHLLLLAWLSKRITKAEINCSKQKETSEKIADKALSLVYDDVKIAGNPKS